MFYYLRLLTGYTYRQYRFRQNCIVFLLKGKLRISGLHFREVEVGYRQSIVIPVGVELDVTILEDADCLLYRFDEPPVLCEQQYEKIILSQQEAQSGCTLPLTPPLLHFVQGIISSLNEGLLCLKYLEIKEQELAFLINSSYSRGELLLFLSPALKSLNRFRCFVLQNYFKVKTVEELADLGKYGVITFRRMFKEEFGEPAYQWMIRQKQEHILYDLTHRDATISEIADKYQFESLPQFSNFCKKSFGASPRELQKRSEESESQRVKESRSRGVKESKER